MDCHDAVCAVEVEAEALRAGRERERGLTRDDMMVGCSQRLRCGSQVDCLASTVREWKKETASFEDDGEGGVVNRRLARSQISLDVCLDIACSPFWENIDPS